MQVKRVVAYTLDSLIVLCIVVCLGLANSLIADEVFRLVVLGVFIVIGVAVVGFEVKCALSIRKKAVEGCPISKLILLGENNQPIKIWELTGKIGLLIGKSTGEQEAEIDLSKTAFHAAIEDTHAVLNYAAGSWWLEDISINNGVKIQRGNGVLLLAAKAPARLMAGDIICIAEDTLLAVN